MLEAFRALNALNEDIFSLDADGVGKLSDFTQNDDLEDDVQIIDPEAETEDDLQDNYIGKVILDCCVCHSKLYKDKSEVDVDETGELANVGEECPYCFTPDGFKVIGEVVAFEDKSEEEDDDEEKEEQEEVEEGLLGDVNVNLDASGQSVGLLGGTGGQVTNESLEKAGNTGLGEGIFDFGYRKRKKEVDRRNAERAAQLDKEFEERSRKARTDWEKEQHEQEARYRETQKRFDAYDAAKRRGSSSSSTSNTAKAGINYSGGDYYSESLEEGIFDKNPSHVLVVMYDENNREKKGQDGYIMAASSDVEKLEARAEELHASYQKNGVDTEIKVVPYKDALKMNIVDGTKKGIKTSVKRHNMDKKNDVNESIEDLSMTANDTHIEVSEEENGKVTVSMEPATNEAGGEMIAPVSAEAEAEIMADEVVEEPAAEEPVEDAPAEEEVPEEGAESEVDADFDEFDEESMDGLGESYFKRVYENVNSFKTMSVKTVGNSMIIEGLLEFNSGNKKNTSFIFEALDATKSGKFRFVGDNKELTEGKKAFMLTGTINNNKLIVESMNYNYKHTDAEGNTSRVYGTERFNKGE